MAKIRKLLSWLQPPSNSQDVGHGSANLPRQSGPSARIDDTHDTVPQRLSTVAVNPAPAAASEKKERVLSSATSTAGHAQALSSASGQADSATTWSTQDVGVAPLLNSATTQEVVLFTGPYDARAPLGYLGEYAIQERLGEGGQGAVFKAIDPRHNRFVAIKIIKGNHQVEERISREAKRTGTDHTNLVRVYGYESTRNIHFLVLEYLEGRTLQSIMAAGPIEVHQAVQWVKQSAVALAAMHTRDILHLDLHPKNIIIRAADGEAVIIDLGLDRESLEDGRHEPQGETLPYISPEHARGSAVDHRSDIYSLGVLLYQMLTGHLPHEGTREQIRNGIVHHPPTLPRTHNRRIHKTLERIIMRCLEKEPEQRYPSARQLLNDLTLWEQYKPTQAHPLQLWERSWLAIAHRNRLASLSILFVTMLALTSTIYAIQINAQALRTAQAHQDTRLLLSNTLGAAASFESVSNGLSQELLRKSRPYYEKVLAVNQNIPDKLAEVAEANFSLAFTLNSLKDKDKAEQYSQAADKCFLDLQKRQSLSADELRLLTIYHMERALLAEQLGHELPTEECRDAYDQAIAFGQQLVERYEAPAAEASSSTLARTEYRELLASAYTNLGSYLFKQAQYIEAIKAKQSAIDLINPLTKQDPTLTEKCVFLEQDQGLAHHLLGDEAKANAAYARADSLITQAPTVDQAIPRFEKLLAEGQHLADQAQEPKRPELFQSAQQRLGQSLRLSISILRTPALTPQTQSDWIERILRALDATVGVQGRARDSTFDVDTIMNVTDQLLSFLIGGIEAEQIQQRLQTHAIRYRLNSLYSKSVLEDLEPIVLLAPGQYGQPINRILLARQYVLKERLPEAFEQLGKLNSEQLNGDLQFDLACVYCLVAQAVSKNKGLATTNQPPEKDIVTDMAAKAIALLNLQDTQESIRKIDFKHELDNDLNWLKLNRSEEIERIRKATGK